MQEEEKRMLFLPCTYNCELLLANKNSKSERLAFVSLSAKAAAAAAANFIVKRTSHDSKLKLS